jgi:hypothetical protein
LSFFCWEWWLHIDGCFNRLVVQLMRLSYSKIDYDWWNITSSLSKILYEYCSCGWGLNDFPILSTFGELCLSSMNPKARGNIPKKNWRIFLQHFNFFCACMLPVHQRCSRRRIWRCVKVVIEGYVHSGKNLRIFRDAADKKLPLANCSEIDNWIYFFQL